MDDFSANSQQMLDQGTLYLLVITFDINLKLIHNDEMISTLYVYIMIKELQYSLP